MSDSDQDILDYFKPIVCSCIEPILNFNHVRCLRCGLVVASKLRRIVCLCSGDCKPFTNYQNIKVCEACGESVWTEKNVDEYFKRLNRYYSLTNWSDYDDQFLK